MTLTAGRLREVVHYCPETGVFTYIKPTGRRAKAGSVAGVAGYSIGKSGKRYVACPKISIDCRRYYVSILAWLYVHGEMPSREVDHKDRDRTNNRIENLRLATRQQNNTNKGAQSNNKLGLKGVSKARGKRHGYEARCNRKYLGYFKTPEEAHLAYCAAAIETFGQYGGVS